MSLNDVVKVLKGFEGHAGRPGKRGGSAPRAGGGKIGSDAMGAGTSAHAELATQTQLRDLYDAHSKGSTPVPTGVGKKKEGTFRVINRPGSVSLNKKYISDPAQHDGKDAQIKITEVTRQGKPSRYGLSSSAGPIGSTPYKVDLQKLADELGLKVTKTE